VASSDTTFMLMAIAVLISSVALLLLAFAAIGIFFAVKRMEAEIVPLVPLTADFIAKSGRNMEEVIAQFRESSAKTQALIDDVRGEVKDFGVARAEITDRVQAEMQRIEIVLDSSLADVQDIVSTVHNGVVTPIRKASGFLAGLLVAVRTFMRVQRPDPSQVAHDEETFIG